MDIPNRSLRILGAIGASTLVGFLLVAPVMAQAPLVADVGSAVKFTFSTQMRQQSDPGVDFENAIPMPLPEPRRYAAFRAEAMPSMSVTDTSRWPPGSVAGSRGTGKTSAIQLVPKKKNLRRMSRETQGPNADSGVVAPQEFGTSQQVFTTSRVDPYGFTKLASYYPFSAAGKLFFKKGATSYVCSASLIRPGIVVTAAHCAVEWGQQRIYSNFAFAPGYRNGTAPYGTWTVGGGSVLSSYFYGTPGNCTQDAQGVVCDNDIVVMILNPQYPQGYPQYAGDSTGWLGYAWNGWGYNSQYQALISQLGYPVNLDSGAIMERTDSQGYVDFNQKINTIIGSLQTGGSSGGPWIVNLGAPPSLSNTSFGSASSHNMVVAVTSWGYINDAIKQQGASAFTSNNIVPLINAVCPADTGPCHP